MEILCVAAIFVVYPGIQSVGNLGSDELIEWYSENRCPDEARTVVCYLQEPRVAATDVSSSQQECYYYGYREYHNHSVFKAMHRHPQCYRYDHWW